MTTNQARQVEMLQRVRRFAEQNLAILSSRVTTESVETIAKAVDTIDAQRVSGLSARRDGSGARKAARRDLEQRLLVISRTMRVVTPADKALFSLPRPRSDQRILTTAHVFLKKIEPLRDRLRDYSLPDTMIPELVTAVETFEDALDRRRGSRQTHTYAVADIQHSLAAGMVAVRTLDVIVANALDGNPVLKASWDRARKVDYSRRTRRKIRKEPRP